MAIQCRLLCRWKNAVARYCRQNKNKTQERGRSRPANHCWCDSLASQESILTMLRDQDGITLTPRGGSRRLVFGVPGYMANLPGEMVLYLLERQTRSCRRVVCSTSHCTTGLIQLYSLMLISVPKSIWTSGWARSQRI